MSEDYKLLQKLCSISAPSSDESRMARFIVDYVEKNSSSWHRKPHILYGEEFQDCVMLVWGNPRTAIFAHIDSVAYMVGYNKTLVPVGSPRCEDGTELVGLQDGREVSCVLREVEDELYYESAEELERGTLLTYKPDFSENGDFIESPFLDNRVGVYVALRLAETMENGAIVFSTGEETRSGNAKFCWRFLYENYHFHNALIADITWITEGIEYNKGCVVSLKDSNLPRKTFVDKILNIAKSKKIDIQREVETAGGSDGGSLQSIPYAVNWCFVGAAQEFPHTPKEKIHKNDIESMYLLYKELMEYL
ncbi:MAG: hypothetical protein MJ198_08975 [Bacteroidales bacterium]|nr:hypothetical protein [Bacteroidales bacterium]